MENNPIRHSVRLGLVQKPADLLVPGGNFTFRVSAESPDFNYLEGLVLEVSDESGNKIRDFRVIFAMAEYCETDMITLPVPKEPGTHVYKITFQEQTRKNHVFEAAELPLPLEVQAIHRISIQTWGIPSAVAADSVVDVNVGVKCSAGCSLSGTSLTVTDADGNPVGSATLSDAEMSGSLFTAKIPVRVPKEDGCFAYTVNWSGKGTLVETGHIAPTVAVRIHTSPERSVTAEIVVLTEDGNPLEGMIVSAAGQKKQTDSRGTVSFDVPPYPLKVIVSGGDSYQMSSRTFAVSMLSKPCEIRLSPLDPNEDACG